MDTQSTWTSAVSFWQSNPFRGTSWRWDLADACRFGFVAAPLDDPQISMIRRYQEALSRATAHIDKIGIQRHWPELFAAHAIYTGVDRDQVEARMLSGESLPDISRKVRVPDGVLQTYANVFFDVLGSLSAITWLLEQAVGTAMWRHRPPTDADVLRYVGLAAGPVMIDALLGCDGWPAEDRERLWQKGRLAVRGFAASMWPQSYDLDAILAEEKVVFADVLRREQKHNKLLAHQIAFTRGISNQLASLRTEANCSPERKKLRKRRQRTTAKQIDRRPEDEILETVDPTMTAPQDAKSQATSAAPVPKCA